MESGLEFVEKGRVFSPGLASPTGKSCRCLIQLVATHGCARSLQFRILEWRSTQKSRHFTKDGE